MNQPNEVKSRFASGVQGESSRNGKYLSKLHEQHLSKYDSHQQSITIKIRCFFRVYPKYQKSIPATF